MSDPAPNSIALAHGGPDSTNPHVSRLLALGVRGPRRPVDRLIERLCRDDASPWLDRALASLPAQEGIPARELFLEGGQRDHGAAALRDLKGWCKKRAATHPGELEPLLGYFLSLGAGLANRGELISAMPRGQVDEVLLDLASALPEPWCGMLCRAVMAPGSPPTTRRE